MAKQFMTLVAIAVLSAAAGAQVPALRIVVLEGENAVNIIQQKTAVRAVVEVRDRNNLPVPGATVTFALGGQGGATIATGASSITVTTNAAGQAALAGVAPASTGSLQISVAASFKELTATATIVQTNVATAAATAASGTAGAISGGTGGIGTAAITGIVGGLGAIGGGLAVLGGGGSGDDRGTAATTPAPTQTATTGGGTPTVSPSPSPTPAPSPTPSPAPAPTPPPEPLPNCVFAVSPSLLTAPISGGTFGVTVTMTPAACANPNWPVTNVPSFVSVDRLSGIGSGSVTLTIASFTPTESFPTRTSAISIASSVVNIHQPRALSAAP